jgi:hypothetical protein
LRILLPFKKDQNPYLDELIAHSKHSYVYANFRDYHSNYEIINIHWPEALFDWLEPTCSELQELETCLYHWRKYSKIVYTKHDDKGHKKMTGNVKRLFDLIEKNTDVFIHLGSFSKLKFEKKYPLAEHTIIEHPLYKNSFKPLPKNEARRILGISKKSFVIVAPGKIRSIKERNMVLQSFKLFPNMKAEIEFDFPGRVRLKKLFDIKKYLEERFMRNHKPPEYIFNYAPLSRSDFATRISAADIVMIPRIDILNSGNIFLGFTFGKIVVGPRNGNMYEHLKNMGMPTFDPLKLDTIVKALNKGKWLSENDFVTDFKKLSSLEPAKISLRIDHLFEKIQGGN